jgi:hypothetical protein
MVGSVGDNPTVLQQKALQLTPVYANGPLTNADSPRQFTSLDEFVGSGPWDLELSSYFRDCRPVVLFRSLHAALLA